MASNRAHNGYYGPCTKRRLHILFARPLEQLRGRKAKSRKPFPNIQKPIENDPVPCIHRCFDLAASFGLFPFRLAGDPIAESNQAEFQIYSELLWGALWRAAAPTRTP